MLKLIKLRAQLKIATEALAAVRGKTAEYKMREEDLSAALDEAKTEDDIKAVDEEITKLEAESGAAEAEEKTLTETIAGIEKEIDEIEKKAKKAENEERSNNHMPRIYGVTAGDSQRRSEEYYTRENVVAFYNELREAIKNKRAITETDLVIPTETMERIRLAIGDYSNVINEVEKVTLGGKGRVILDGTNPEAIWMEMADAVEELSASFTSLEFDGYKLGGFVPVNNYLLEDSIINLANYIETRIAKAIAKALDKAILNGTGATGKQLKGIIPNIPAANVVTISSLTIPDILLNIGLIDDGEDSTGEIIAIVKRKTWYSRLMSLTYAVTASGSQIIVDARNPHLAGFRVKFSNNMPDDQILFGDFKKYMLIERGSVALSSSEHVRFIEDQKVYKGTARYDGQPVKPSAFVLVNLPAVTAAAQTLSASAPASAKSAL